MRFVRYVSLGLLAIGMTTSVAHADDARVFGTATCAQQFVCSATSQTEVASIAGSCAVQGLGISLSLSGIFDGASTDSNNCLTGQIPVAGNTRPSAVQCCVTSEEDSCKMTCQLLVY